MDTKIALYIVTYIFLLKSKFSDAEEKVVLELHMIQLTSG